MNKTSRKVKYSIHPGWLAVSLVCLFVSLFLLTWSLWSSPSDSAEIFIPEGFLPVTHDDARFKSQSDYSVAVSWSRWIRRGESGAIKLYLKDLSHNNISGDQSQTVQILSVEPVLHYFSIDPPGALQVTIGDEQDLALEWSVKAERQGSFLGKVYLSFVFFDDINTSLVTLPVAVLDFNIDVIDLWGMPSSFTKWLGFSFLFLWGIFLLLAKKSVLKTRDLKVIK